MLKSRWSFWRGFQINESPRSGSITAYEEIWTAGGLTEIGATQNFSIRDNPLGTRFRRRVNGRKAGCQWQTNQFIFSRGSGR